MFRVSRNNKGNALSESRRQKGCRRSIWFSRSQVSQKEALTVNMNLSRSKQHFDNLQLTQHHNWLLLHVSHQHKTLSFIPSCGLASILKVINTKSNVHKSNLQDTSWSHPTGLMRIQNQMYQTSGSESLWLNPHPHQHHPVTHITHPDYLCCGELVVPLIKIQKRVDYRGTFSRCTDCSLGGVQSLGWMLWVLYLLWWRYCCVNMLSSLSSQPALFLTRHNTHILITY